MLASPKGVSKVVSNVAIQENDLELNSSSAVVMLTKCYSLEFNENLNDTRIGLSCDDQQALDIQQLAPHVTLRKVRLLWKRDDIVLPNNRSMAVTCLSRFANVC